MSESRRSVLSKNWNSFLRQSDNKTELFTYLSSQLHLNFRLSDKFVYVTIEFYVGLDQDTSLIIAPYNHEADNRL